MTYFPYPGQPVRGSESGKPIMALFDLLGRRWAMGVLWQLNLGGPSTFRELQSRCESISPAVLNSRIKDLKQANLLERSESGYQVTALGQEFATQILPLSEFAEQWALQLNHQDTQDKNHESK